LPARTEVEARDGKFLQTVDYRYHDGPPSRPYVPWLEGHKSRECDLTAAVPALAHISPVIANADSDFGFGGGTDNVRPAKRMRIDGLKFKRLDIALSALRRACGLSVRA